MNASQLLEVVAKVSVNRDQEAKQEADSGPCWTVRWAPMS
jgi:hypothetical protein